jgi:enterobactin synthetase component D
MNNLLQNLRNINPAMAKNLEANFYEAPHLFSTNITKVALPLSTASEIIDYVPEANLPPSIRQAVRKRKLSFIAGRLCAEKALEKTGLTNAIVHRHESGAPSWPTGVHGSITHTSQFACAAVSRFAEIVSIGIDSEMIFSDTTSNEVQLYCCTENEIAQFFSAENRNLIATILFSAKESLYKSVHPYLNRYVDFKEIDVVAVNWKTSAIHMQPTVQGDLNSIVARCQTYFCICNDSVHISVLMQPD